MIVSCSWEAGEIAATRTGLNRDKVTDALRTIIVIKLTRIRIRCIEIPGQNDEKNDGQWNGHYAETPHNQPVSFRDADNGVEGCPNKQSHQEATKMRFEQIDVSRRR